MFEEFLKVVCALHHDFVRRGSVPRDDLSGQKGLALESVQDLHDQMRDLCETYGADLLFGCEAPSPDTLRHMVGIGGISFFPELYILSEIHIDREFKVLEFDDPEIGREASMDWRWKYRRPRLALARGR